MDNEIVEKFAEKSDYSASELRERWDGRPDLIMEDLFRVPDLDTGQIVDLELFDVQRQVVDAYFYGNPDKLNTYKGRRIGYSFIICCCFLVEAMIKPRSFYAIVSRSKGQADDRIEDIQMLIDEAKVDIPSPTENAGEIELWNDSSFMSYSGDSDGSRGGDSARAVLMDEMAFIEDQKSASRAFGAFIALGQDRTMVQVSTPNVSNDKFMSDHERGTADGYDEDGNWTGVISIKQPSFYNADNIDIHTSLFDQTLQPVRPDFKISTLEEERMSDPQGFGQEYLCRPVVDEYRFFDEDTIELAMGKSQADGYKTGPQTVHGDSWTVIGIDVGIDRDDTVISISENVGEHRYQRYVEAVDHDALLDAGIANPDPGNADHIATRVGQLYDASKADSVVIDKTGMGRFPQKSIEAKIGRGIIGFNFSDYETVSDMMGDMNLSLRRENITLIDNNQMQDQFESIVKQKKEDWSNARFSGKDESKSGKDDFVFATVLSMFPPNMTEQPGDSLSQSTPDHRDSVPSEGVQQKETREPHPSSDAAFATASVNRKKRTRNQRYSTSNRRSRR